MVPTEFCIGCFCAIAPFAKPKLTLRSASLGQSVKNWAFRHVSYRWQKNCSLPSLSRASSAQISGLIAIHGFLKFSGA